MGSNDVTQYSRDNSVKIVLSAFKNNYVVYKSIGSQVTTYRKKKTRSWLFWTSYNWEEDPVDNIAIENTYYGPEPVLESGWMTRNGACSKTSYCELKEWAMGTPPAVSAAYPIEKVKAHTWVRIGAVVYELLAEKR